MDWDYELEASLEDIESELYSQVYHSTENTDENFKSLPEESTDNNREMRITNRYFHPTRGNGLYHKKPPVRYSNIQRDYNWSEGLYSKECNSKRPHKPDISINQVVVVNTSQQTPIVCLANSDGKKSKSAKNRTRKRRERRERRFIERQQKLNQILNEKPKQDNTVIMVSDSEEESCVEIANEWPVLSVADSEDETKTVTEEKDLGDNPTNENNLENQTLGDTTDDVIFVEPSDVSVEVINVDEDFDTTQKIPEEVSAHADVETASVASSSNSFINTYLSKSLVKGSQQERKGTPDSASNDFIGNSSAELRKKDFSFSLHGSDFDNDKFLKPTNPTEVCETESSSSTTDPNALHVLKTAVFNEVEFPKEGIFSEANMESFGNFITPLRKSTVRRTPQSSTPVEDMSDTQLQNVYSSDSSSESDFDEAPKKSKTLPDLSPMLPDKIDNLPQAVNKSKKSLNISSKYDLANNDSPETVTKRQNKRKSGGLEVVKKKIKNKKRKTAKSMTESDETVVETSATVENDGNEETDNEIKRKKKKSREDTDDNSDTTSHSKKKQKIKKKKNIALEPNLTLEQVNQLTTQSQLGVVIEDNEKDSSEVSQSTTSLINAQNEVVEAHSTQEQPLFDSVKVEKDNEQVENQTQTTISDSEVKVEQNEMTNKLSESTENVDNKADNVTTEVKHEELLEHDESSQDVIIIENKLEEVAVVLSDSESVLSPLREQEDIQLNCANQSSNKEIVTVDQTTVNLTHCSLEEVQHNMSNDPKLWTILDIDRIPAVRGSMKRCNKCREKGHMAIKCPNMVVPKCRLCGEGGHYEPRCPNRICTQCGTRTPFSTTSCGTCFKYRNYQCELCQMTGHPSTACPDLWRRYHLTTTDGPLKSSNGPLLKPKNKLWCSGCARSGHLEYTCRFFKSLYPPTDPRIKSYDDVYQENREEQEQQFVGLPLFTVNNYNENYQPQPLGATTQNYHEVYNNNENNYGAHVQQDVIGNANVLLNTQQQYQQGGNYYVPYNQQDLTFTDNLPNFISFDNRISCNNNSFTDNGKRAHPATSVTKYTSQSGNRRIFFSSPVEQIKNFIKTELQQLFILERNLDQMIKNVKKSPGRAPSKMKTHNRRLNMILFGIYKFKDGYKHLSKLKAFKFYSPKTKLNSNKRRELFFSYCYIFGIEKHRDLNYNELLNRI